MIDLDLTHPAITDLARTAKARLPRFVWEYLDSGTGADRTRDANRASLDAVTLTPRVLRGHAAPDLSVTLMGREQALPFGIAPVGMSGLMRGNGEVTLARAAAAHAIPYGLSTVAAATPEQLAPHIGAQGWFQLYPPRDPAIRRDLLARAAGAGFHTLILTADVATASRRERQRRARLTNPMRFTPRVIVDAALHPAWAIDRLRHGIPRLATLDPYADTAASRGGTEHAGYMLRTAPDMDYLAALRDEWDGKLVVKGILHADDAAMVAPLCDAVWVSNHGGRQFDAAPAPATVLPAIRAALGPGAQILVDGGVASGTDILRYLALGADFVMSGRAFHHGLAAFGAAGVDHAIHILRASLEADMGQLGLARLADLPPIYAPAPLP